MIDTNGTQGAAPTALAIREETVTAISSATGFLRPQIHTVMRHLFKSEGTEADLWLFLTRCQRTGLDPFAGQIIPQFRWDSRQGRKVMVIVTTVDGFRLTGHRALKSRFRGIAGPYWKAKGGEWTDLWEDDGPPYAAKVGIYVEGCAEPVWGVAKWSEFAQRDSKGGFTGQWSNMPSNQLAKCAETQAWRKAAPLDTANLAIGEEVPETSEAGQVHAEQMARYETAMPVQDRAASPRYRTPQPASTPEERREAARMRVARRAEELGAGEIVDGEFVPYADSVPDPEPDPPDGAPDDTDPDAWAREWLTAIAGRPQGPLKAKGDAIQRVTSRLEDAGIDRNAVAPLVTRLQTGMGGGPPIGKLTIWDVIDNRLLSALDTAGEQELVMLGRIAEGG